MEKNQHKIPYFTRFSSVTSGGGGSRRLVQILEACPKIDWQLVSSQDVSLPLFWGLSLYTVLRLLDRSSYILKGWGREHCRGAKNLWEIADFWAKKFKFSRDCRVALVDDPIYFKPLVPKLKAVGIKIVGMCHNLESLSGIQVAEGQQRKLLDHELQLLGECDLVVTISREETFLLENLGVRTFFFPYFPARSIYARLMKIRKGRADTPKKDILIVGTAKNKATRHGMIEAMRHWQEQGLGKSGDDLLLAGYATDSLKEFAGRGTRFLGPLSDEELDKRLLTVRACLCYQEQASGALTRIPEMLIAGVPVLANPLAARTYYNLQGVYEFSNFARLREALEFSHGGEEEISVPPAPDAEALQAAIIEVAS